MTEANLNEAAETEQGYGQLFGVLLRRRFWFLGVFFSVLSMAGFVTLITKPTYESSMQLLVESNYQEKTKEGAARPESEFADANVEMDYATQLNLMRSSQLIQRAVDWLSLKYPAIDVEEIKKSLVLTQVVEEGEEKVDTKIFQVDYTDNDPLKTQEVLEAIQKVYQDYNREQQQQRLTNGLAFIDQQLPKVRQSVVQAETALERFRKNHNLIDPEQRATDIADSLQVIEQERQATRAQYQQSQRRYAALQQQVKRSPEDALVSSRLSQSSRYQDLLNEIQKTELDLAQQRLRFADTHPYVQKLIAQRQSQLALLKKMGSLVGGDSAQQNASEKSVLEEGQLGETDQTLTRELLAAQTDTLSLRTRDQSLAQSEQQLRAELNQFPSLLAEYNRLQPEVQLKRNTLQQLLKARQDLSLAIARGGFGWQVVEAPQRGSQISPNIKVNLLLGAVVGLFLGGVAAFIREAIDDAVYTPDELKQHLELPLLGVTPALPPNKVGKQSFKLPFYNSKTKNPSIIQVVQQPPFRESLDLIYKNIEFLNSGVPSASLMITSALAGEGKSMVALGLAFSAARLHQRVLLIDVDLRSPSLHKQLNLPNEQGLSTLLTNKASVSEPSNSSISGTYIDILTSGPALIDDPATLLSSQRMGELLDAFEETYDLVLLDAPPILGSVDALITASFSSGIVMVESLGHVSRADLAQATAMLSNLNVIGVVANGVSSPRSNYSSNAEQYSSPSFRLYQPLMSNQVTTTTTTKRI